MAARAFSRQVDSPGHSGLPKTKNWQNGIIYYDSNALEGMTTVQKRRFAARDRHPNADEFFFIPPSSDRPARGRIP
jgi:hypothetical protein